MSLDGWMDGENSIYKVILFSLKNEGNAVLCENVDVCWRNYKWNKSVTKRQKQHNYTYELQYKVTTPTEVEWWLPGAWGLFSVYTIQLCKIKSILEICICMLIVNNTVLVTQSWADPMNFATSWTVARQAPLSMEYRGGWHFHPPGDHPSPGIEPRSPALLVGSLMSELLGKPNDTSLYT